MKKLFIGLVVGSIVFFITLITLVVRGIKEDLLGGYQQETWLLMGLMLVTLTISIALTVLIVFKSKKSLGLEESEEDDDFYLKHKEEEKNATIAAGMFTTM